ncbi:ketoacyl-ACP synthase III [Burkholderia plantarii]|uniref:3-oxoacyl-(Acyl carrier protein) synthase III FabH n=1 Tax=Burkholderia plantarii TaxID=41899 RepID=A0A0B6RMS9_BURPL|nr:ketoacyl-ACP synthase III [Burkholderia plantarii]AJK44693.1 3-oxoacyl-(acyl carrier protein) synthase III FabH [Burkholderia plantarii]
MNAPLASVGRELRSGGARIAGVVSCVPARELANDVFVERFGEAGVRDVVKMIGVERRRVAAAGETAGDLCRAAGAHLLRGLGWRADGVDAVLFVSQTPDYRLPGTAFVLQAAWGLPAASIALDINLGCSGYPQALWLGMNLIRSGAARRVLLAVGDTISKLVDPDDRATALLFGDAGTVTALEADPEAEDAVFVIGSDGAGVPNLIVPGGGCRESVVAATPAGMPEAAPEADPRLAGRSRAHLFMDGGEIFNFTLRRIPPLVARTLELAGHGVPDHDAFLFHQANLFMLKHLAKKAGLPGERVPVNLTTYGNTSCASIPLLMTTELREALATRRQRLAMFGFGVGYSWASASLVAGPLAVVDTIES